MNVTESRTLGRPAVMLWAIFVPALIFGLFALAVLRWHWSMGGFVGRQLGDSLVPRIPLGMAVVGLLNTWALARSWTSARRLLLLGLLLPLAALILLNALVLHRIRSAPVVVAVPHCEDMIIVVATEV